MKNKEKVVRTICPDVGHGNPSEMLALIAFLQKEGWAIQHFSPFFASFLGSMIHESISNSLRKTEQYNTNGEHDRARGLAVFGAISFFEQELSEVLHPQTKPAQLLMAVQEHPLVHIHRSDFPLGAFLSIPDVLNKKSAISVLKTTGIHALPWTLHAHESLQSQGIASTLVQPHLLSGMRERLGIETLGPLTDRVVVKFSGSGAPKEVVMALQRQLDQTQIEYTIFCKDQVLKSGTKPGKIPGRIRQIDAFYRDLLLRPPRLVLSPPSEMIQLMAELYQTGTKHLSLPPRGMHEVINMRLAQEYAITDSTVLSPMSMTDAEAVNLIYRVYDAHPLQPRTREIGLESETSIPTLLQSLS